MAGVTLDKIPPALALNGSELLWLYQSGGNQITPWIGIQCTLDQLQNFVLYGPQTPYVYTTMRQLLGALQTQGMLYTAFSALPSDVTNTFNIAWNHATNITIQDPFIVGFLQPTLGYSQAQLQTLFALANAIPQYIAGTATMRQLIAAMASESTLVPVFDAVPSDITNAYNIAWNHANYMPITDPFITGFLQPTLGYNSSQMTTFYAYALTFAA